MLSKRFFIFSGLALILVILLAGIANRIIERETEGLIFDEAEKLPHTKTGLLLGTSPVLRGGYKNPYFDNRIAAAVKLYKLGIIKLLIVSGDNRRSDYNEPRAMRAALVKAGVPDSCIISDFAGLRTLDSVIRTKEIFSQDSIIVISQRFHNQRAVYIARRYGIVAFGFNAKDVSARVGYKTQVREFFARAKVFLDLWLSVQPKHLGEKISI